MDAHDLEQLERDLIGDFDPSFLVNAAAELANKGIAEKQKADAAQHSAADDAEKSKAAIAADVVATEACAQAQAAAPAEREAAQLAAQQATQAQDMAGMGLSPGAQAKRVAAAQAAATKASAAWKASPSSAILAARAKCAQATVSKAMMGGMSMPGGQPMAEASGDGFFKKMIGPMEVWQWGLVGVGVAALATGAALLFRRRKG